MLESSFQVICSFKNIEWKIFTFNCYNHKEYFLYQVFNRLNYIEIVNLEQLSVCQLCESEEEIYPFIQESNGKFYFEPLTENDSDNLRVRDQYLSTITN
jgi:hypothetical protein